MSSHNSLQNQYYNYNFNNTYNNIFQNNLIPRRSYESSNNYIKINSIILKQTNPNFENKNLINRTIGKNNQIKLIKNNYSSNICTYRNIPKTINNFYKPRKNYFYKNNNYNNNGLHIIKSNRRNNSCREKINLNNLNYLNDINQIDKISVRNKTPNYKNNSIIFISHLSNPQYENISFSSNQPKIKNKYYKSCTKIKIK